MFPDHTAISRQCVRPMAVGVVPVVTAIGVRRGPTAVMVRTVTTMVVVMMILVMVVMMVMVAAALGPFAPVGRAGQMPAFERHAAVASRLAVVDGRVVAVTACGTAAVRRVPAAQPHAPREEQLEEQPFELLAEYHVDDEVHGRVDGDQQVADLDQLVDRYAVERLGHVRYERPHVAQQEHDDHAQQHGGQPDLLLLQPRQPLPFPVRQSHL